MVASSQVQYTYISSDLCFHSTKQCHIRSDLKIVQNLNVVVIKIGVEIEHYSFAYLDRVSASKVL